MNSAHRGTAPEHLQLPRLDRLNYFAPALFFAYLAALCGALILTSIFLVRVRNPEAIAGAGVFGLLVTAGFGTLLVRAQLDDLRYTHHSAGRRAKELCAGLGYHARDWLGHHPH